MSDQESGTSEDKPKPSLEGNTIVSAASNAAADFFTATFPALEERITQIVAANITDEKLQGAIDTMTKDFLDLLQKRLSTLFTNIGKAPTDGK